jgi:hypothetical protein
MATTTTTPVPVTLDEIMKELKATRKEVRKIRQFIEDPTGEKQEARVKNNGFNKPQKVTDALRVFVGLQEGEMILSLSGVQHYEQVLRGKWPEEWSED